MEGTLLLLTHHFLQKRSCFVYVMLCLNFLGRRYFFLSIIYVIKIWKIVTSNVGHVLMLRTVLLFTISNRRDFFRKTFFPDRLKDTMFYVCQGSCLCGTVNNRGKVIYCYGDLVPRHGELFAEGADQQGSTSSKDLLAAQLGIWTFGIFALWVSKLDWIILKKYVLRKSVVSVWASHFYSILIQNL